MPNLLITDYKLEITSLLIASLLITNSIIINY